MKEFAEGFYSSRTWKRTREAYKKSVGYLCEECLSKGIVRYGDIVHHKTHISPENIDDPSITLNWDNLQCVCRDCHERIHRQKEKRYTVDEYGRVTAQEA